MHEVLVNRLGGLSLPRKSVVRLTDRPDMTLDVYRGRKTTIQPTSENTLWKGSLARIYFSKADNRHARLAADTMCLQISIGMLQPSDSYSVVCPP